MRSSALAALPAGVALRRCSIRIGRADRALLGVRDRAWSSRWDRVAGRHPRDLTERPDDGTLLAASCCLFWHRLAPAPRGRRRCSSVWATRRATYSELHEGLRAGTPGGGFRPRRPAGRSVRRSSGGGCAPPLRAGAVERRSARAHASGRASGSGVRRQRARLARERSLTGRWTAPPGQDPADLLAPLRAVRAGAGARGAR